MPASLVERVVHAYYIVYSFGPVNIYNNPGCLSLAVLSTTKTDWRRPSTEVGGSWKGPALAGSLRPGAPVRLRTLANRTAAHGGGHHQPGGAGTLIKCRPTHPPRKTGRYFQSPAG